MPIDPELLSILVCPKCRGALRHEEDRDELVCDECRLAFSIENDIPVMLLEEARAIE